MTRCVPRDVGASAYTCRSSTHLGDGWRGQEGTWDPSPGARKGNISLDNNPKGPHGSDIDIGSLRKETKTGTVTSLYVKLNSLFRGGRPKV